MLQKKRDWYFVIIFTLAALFLYTFNLGEVSLRDWDESIVASVAREIWRSPLDNYAWLYPKTIGGDPYWNKPPLIHDLIALSYSIFGVSEWSTRLPTAILSALCVPLVYCIGREIFSLKATAIYSTLVYLTLIPVVRHGRLAMLDGTITFFSCLIIFSLVRWRNNRGNLWSGVLGLALLCLTKGIVVGILILSIAFCFLILDYRRSKSSDRRIKKSYYSLFWFILGFIPILIWYILQYQHYGEQFLNINLGNQTLERIWTSVDNNSQPLWYYVLEIVKYTAPWLIFLPGGIILAFRQRNLIWAKLTLVWSCLYLLAISIMATKLPWYVIPLYPAFAFFVGVNLSQMAEFPIFRKSSRQRLTISLCILTVSIWGVYSYYQFWSQQPDKVLAQISFILGLSLTITTFLLSKGSRHFISTIAIGLYISLILLFNSSHWNWELAEAYPVKPIANRIESQTVPGEIIYTSYPYNRPSLNFYSDRKVIPISQSKLQENWLQNRIIYFLLPDKEEIYYTNDGKFLDSDRVRKVIRKNST